MDRQQRSLGGEGRYFRDVVDGGESMLALVLEGVEVRKGMVGGEGEEGDV